MAHLRISILTFFALCSLNCSRNLDDLLQSRSIQDSLQSGVPSIVILSPGQDESVFSPVLFKYETRNWQIENGGRHIQVLVNGENKVISYHSTEFFLDLDSGDHHVELVLAHPDFSKTSISDSVFILVKPIPDSLHVLTVENGTGSGIYAEGTLVEVSAYDLQFRTFRSWVGDTSLFLDATLANADLIMPAGNAFVKAEFDTVPISYQNEISLIIQDNCLSCHSGLSPPDLSSCQGLRNNAATVLDRIQDVFNPMPPGGLLPDDQIKKIQEWYAQAAKCD